MGWIEETNRHEGHVKVVYADGRLGGGTSSAAGLSVDGPDGEYELRPPAAVVGWRVACDHVPAHVSDDDLGRSWVRTEQWLSPLTWHRVYSPDQEDLEQRRIYAPLHDDYSIHVGDRPDVEELLVTEWRQHIEPEDHSRSIRAAVEAIAAAQQLLELEVTGGRATGMSWADIGRAAGITRQAARERWSNPTS